MAAKYEYECLTLGDADAIIIRHFQIEDGVEKSYVIVIDAGKRETEKKLLSTLRISMEISILIWQYAHIRIVITRMGSLI